MKRNKVSWKEWAIDKLSCQVKALEVNWSLALQATDFMIQVLDQDQRNRQRKHLPQMAIPTSKPLVVLVDRWLAAAIRLPSSNRQPSTRRPRLLARKELRLLRPTDHYRQPIVLMLLCRCSTKSRKSLIKSQDCQPRGNSRKSIAWRTSEQSLLERSLKTLIERQEGCAMRRR